MRKTKANFRALRESCGLTQQDMADLVGVDVRSIKRWEREDNDLLPSDAAFNELAERYERMQDQVETMLVAFDQLEENAGFESDFIPMAYYRTQEQLDKRLADKGMDDLHEPVGFVNAQTRMIADALIADGRDVEFVYPEGFEFVQSERVI